jgi:hypothetical protein
MLDETLQHYSFPKLIDMQHRMIGVPHFVRRTAGGGCPHKNLIGVCLTLSEEPKLLAGLELPPPQLRCR